MTTKDTLTLLREVEAALQRLATEEFAAIGFRMDTAKQSLPAIQELVRRASVAPVASGWMPIKKKRRGKGSWKNPRHSYYIDKDGNRICAYCGDEYPPPNKPKPKRPCPNAAQPPQAKGE